MVKIDSKSEMMHRISNLIYIDSYKAERLKDYKTELGDTDVEEIESVIYGQLDKALLGVPAICIIDSEDNNHFAFDSGYMDEEGNTIYCYCTFGRYESDSGKIEKIWMFSGFGRVTDEGEIGNWLKKNTNDKFSRLVNSAYKLDKLRGNVSEALSGYFEKLKEGVLPDTNVAKILAAFEGERDNFSEIYKTIYNANRPDNIKDFVGNLSEEKEKADKELRRRKMETAKKHLELPKNGKITRLCEILQYVQAIYPENEDEQRILWEALGETPYFSASARFYGEGKKEIALKYFILGVIFNEKTPDEEGWDNLELDMLDAWSSSLDAVSECRKYIEVKLKKDQNYFDKWVKIESDKHKLRDISKRMCEAAANKKTEHGHAVLAALMLIAFKTGSPEALNYFMESFSQRLGAERKLCVALASYLLLDGRFKDAKTILDIVRKNAPNYVFGFEKLGVELAKKDETELEDWTGKEENRVFLELVLPEGNNPEINRVNAVAYMGIIDETKTVMVANVLNRLLEYFSELYGTYNALYDLSCTRFEGYLPYLYKSLWGLTHHKPNDVSKSYFRRKPVELENMLATLKGIICVAKNLNTDTLTENDKKWVEDLKSCDIDDEVSEVQNMVEDNLTNKKEQFKEMSDEYLSYITGNWMGYIENIWRKQKSLKGIFDCSCEIKNVEKLGLARSLLRVLSAKRGEADYEEYKKALCDLKNSEPSERFYDEVNSMYRNNKFYWNQKSVDLQLYLVSGFVQDGSFDNLVRGRNAEFDVDILLKMPTEDYSMQFAYTNPLKLAAENNYEYVKEWTSLTAMLVWYQDFQMTLCDIAYTQFDAGNDGVAAAFFATLKKMNREFNRKETGKLKSYEWNLWNEKYESKYRLAALFTGDENMMAKVKSEDFHIWSCMNMMYSLLFSKRTDKAGKIREFIDLLSPENKDLARMYVRIYDKSVDKDAKLEIIKAKEDFADGVNLEVKLYFCYMLKELYNYDSLGALTGISYGTEKEFKKDKEYLAERYAELTEQMGMEPQDQPKHYILLQKPKSAQKSKPFYSGKTEKSIAKSEKVNIRRKNLGDIEIYNYVKKFDSLGELVDDFNMDQNKAKYEHMRRSFTDRLEVDHIGKIYSALENLNGWNTDGNSVKDKEEKLNEALTTLNNVSKVSRCNELRRLVSALVEKELNELANRPKLRVNILNKGAQSKGTGYLFGVVSNEGRATARDIRLQMNIYNEKERVMEQGNPYVLERLSPGNEAVFEISYSVWRDLDHITYELGTEYFYKAEKYTLTNIRGKFDLEEYKEPSYDPNGLADNVNGIKFNVDNAGKVYSEEFVGRKSETEKLRNLVKKNDFSQYQSALIYGIRRIGKTSLLRYLSTYVKEKCKDEAVCVSVDAQSHVEGKDIQSVFVDNVLQKLEFNAKRLIEGKEDEWNEFCKKYKSYDYEKTPSNLKEFYMALSGFLGRGLYLIIDEIDSLFQSLENSSNEDLERLLDVMCTLVTDEDYRRAVCFAICGSNWMIRYRREVNSQYFQRFVLIPVGKLSRDEVKEVICKPYRDSDLTIKDETIDWIWKYLGGFVWHTKKLGNEAVARAYMAKRTVLYPSDVQQSLSAVLNYNDGKQFLEGCEKNEKAVVYAMQSLAIRPNYNISIDKISKLLNSDIIDKLKLQNALEVLMDLNVVEQNPYNSAEYHFADDIYRKYFRTLSPQSFFGRDKEEEYRKYFSMNSTDLSRGDEEPDVFSEDRQDDEVDDYEDTTGLL